MKKKIKYILFIDQEKRQEAGREIRRQIGKEKLQI